MSPSKRTQKTLSKRKNSYPPGNSGGWILHQGELLFAELATAQDGQVLFQRERGLRRTLVFLCGCCEGSRNFLFCHGKRHGRGAPLPTRGDLPGSCGPLSRWARLTFWIGKSCPRSLPGSRCVLVRFDKLIFLIALIFVIHFCFPWFLVSGSTARSRDPETDCAVLRVFCGSPCRTQVDHIEVVG